MTANNSSCWLFLIIHDNSSLKSYNFTSLQKLHSSGSVHTKSSSIHDHNACKEYSVEARHLTHKSSFVILRRNKECFVGMRQARHSNVFTFYGTCMDHICFQTCVPPFFNNSCALLIISSSIFKNL